LPILRLCTSHFFFALRFFISSMTTTPSLDIIIPVWNSPAETRACLVSILESSATARLIIVNNGCDRVTELMLEEFSDHLADRAIYMTMERNIGFVPAVNRALLRSDADWALIVRPTGMVTAACIDQILAATQREQSGMVTPHCSADFTVHPQFLKNGCASIETAEISFSALALSRLMREQIGLFDEELDGGVWCLRDYRHRSHARGFRCHLVPHVSFAGGQGAVFGSEERRRMQRESAVETFRARWGEQQQLAVYLPRSADERSLSDTLQLLLNAARHGHRFMLYLHRRHHRTALQLGAACLHSGVILHRLATLAPQRDLVRELERQRKQIPGLQLACALGGVSVPGSGAAAPAGILHQLAKS
jgi:hypothetical protein